MINFSELKDNIILICPNTNTRTLIKELMKDEKNYTKHIKFMDKKEVLEGAYFSYDLKALYYIHKNKGYSFELSKEILKNLIGIDNKEIKDPSKNITTLVDIYNELIDKNYLTFNPYFKNLFKNKEVIINGYSTNDKDLLNALNRLDVTTYKFIPNIEEIDNDNTRDETSIRNIKNNNLYYEEDLVILESELKKLNKKLDAEEKSLEKDEDEIKEIKAQIKEKESEVETAKLIYANRKANDKILNKLKVLSFKNMDEELIYVINKICELIMEENVSPNNIYLYNIPAEYEVEIIKYFELYHLPIDYGQTIKLYDSPIYKEFIDLLKDNTIVNAYKKLCNEYNENETSESKDEFGCLPAIVGIITDLDSLIESKQIDEKDYESIKEVLNYLAKNKNLNMHHYEECIKVCDSSYCISDNDYVFMLGFSIGNYPVVKKDTELLSDEENNTLLKNTSIEKNEINEEQLIYFINTTKNITITYKEKIGKDVYYPSILTKLRGLHICKGVISNTRYSIDQAKQEVAKYYDLERMYGIKTKGINTFKEEDVNFQIYNNEFKFDEYKGNENLKLSFSSIDDYNNCPFKYYIDYILRVGIYEDRFDSNFGSLCHKILEEYVKNKLDPDDFEKYVEDNYYTSLPGKQSFIDKTFKTYQEKYFIKKLLPQIKDVIIKNNKFMKDSKFNNPLVESEFLIKFKGDDKTLLNGKIDKLLLDENSNVLIIDYKTKKQEFHIKRVSKGFDLQLPIYGYILKQIGTSNDISKNKIALLQDPDKKVCGIYFQDICLKTQELNSEKNKYVLDGITTDDENIIKEIDPTVFDGTGKASEFFNNLKLNGKGKGPINSYFKRYDIDEIIEEAGKQIQKTVDNIRNGNFEILPIKKGSEEDTSCKYCKFKGICYRDPLKYKTVVFNDEE